MDVAVQWKMPIYHNVLFNFWLRASLDWAMNRSYIEGLVRERAFGTDNLFKAYLFNIELFNFSLHHFTFSCLRMQHGSTVRSMEAHLNSVLKSRTKITSTVFITRMRV